MRVHANVKAERSPEIRTLLLATKRLYLDFGG